MDNLKDKSKVIQVNISRENGEYRPSPFVTSFVEMTSRSIDILKARREEIQKLEKTLNAKKINTSFSWFELEITEPLNKIIRESKEISNELEVSNRKDINDYYKFLKSIQKRVTEFKLNQDLLKINDFHNSLIQATDFLVDDFASNYTYLDVKKTDGRQKSIDFNFLIKKLYKHINIQNNQESENEKFYLLSCLLKLFILKDYIYIKDVSEEISSEPHITPKKITSSNITKTFYRTQPSKKNHQEPIKD